MSAEPTLLDELMRLAQARPDPRTRRDHGARLAENSAHTSWRLAAEATLRRLAASGCEFTTDDVHAAVGSPPGHHNAVGGLFIAAARRREIVPTGYRPSARPEANRRAVRTWQGRR